MHSVFGKINWWFKKQQLILGTGTVIWWITEPYWFHSFSCVVKMHIDDARVIIYDRNMLIIQASVVNVVEMPKWSTLQLLHFKVGSSGRLIITVVINSAT